ncbi:conserved hypothetical protein [Thermotomaculum hydrothermale]|uniref:DUF304 domain-containing protein n=1 Tax=Thermotomaculum hydrothermale TaxID=981385 RepID=A0A7R6PGB6_9BACT|nr:hypothetical protein [Thermotomaculum hydrothermale]BBB33214.1 conserved hypothetical protein [Thermotomaculum hydrothermale]
MESIKDFQNLEEKLNSFLKKDEKVLWEGKPEKNFYMEGIDYYVFFIGFVMLLFSLFNIISSLKMHSRGGRDIVGAIFSIPFLLIGFYLALGRYIHRYKKIKNTRYFITNKRIILSEKFFGDCFLSYINIKNIEKIDKKTKRNGLADLTFSKGSLTQSEMKESLLSSERIMITFRNIRDYQNVLAIVTDIKNR